METTAALTWNGYMRGTLVAGKAVEVADAALRPIALLAPEVVATYIVETDSSVELAVFRTAPPAGKWLETIPGVDQPVQILLRVRGRRRIIRVERAIRFLVRCDIDLERPSDGFWGRLSYFAHRRWIPLRIPMVIDLLERDGVISPPNRRSRRWKEMHELLKRARKLREKNAMKAARREATNARRRGTRSVSGRSHQEPCQGCPEGAGGTNNPMTREASTCTNRTSDESDDRKLLRKPVP
jgi:hypothetical protein